MLDLLGCASHDIETTFLEPACGNGNFVAELVDRKLTSVAKRWAHSQDDYEFGVVRALSSVYGIDIDKANVVECRERLAALVRSKYSGHLNTRRPRIGFLRAAQFVIENNIIVGDALLHREGIPILEYTFDGESRRVSVTRHTLASILNVNAGSPDLFDGHCEPPTSDQMVPFLKLGI